MFPPPVCGIGCRCLCIHPNSPVVIVVVGLRLVSLGSAAGALWEGQFGGRHRPPDTNILVLWDGGGPGQQQQQGQRQFNDGISEQQWNYFFQSPPITTAGWRIIPRS